MGKNYNCKTATGRRDRTAAKWNPECDGRVDSFRVKSILPDTSLIGFLELADLQVPMCVIHRESLTHADCTSRTLKVQNRLVISPQPTNLLALVILFIYYDLKKQKSSSDIKPNFTTIINLKIGNYENHVRWKEQEMDMDTASNILRTRLSSNLFATEK